MSKKNIGSSFEDFLKEDGIYQEVTSHAVKRIIAWQLSEAMKARKISRNEMARRMKTSRTQITRQFDPDNEPCATGHDSESRRRGRETNQHHS